MGRAHTVACVEAVDVAWHPDQVRYFSRGPTHCVATWQNLLFQLWRGELSVEPLNRTIEANRLIHEHFPKGVVPFSIIEENTAMPAADVRRAAAMSWKTTRANVRAVATVVEGSGFWVSAARAVITGITMVDRGSAPQRAFSTTEDAVHWLDRQHLLGDGNGSHALTQTITALRAELDRQT